MELRSDEGAVRGLRRYVQLVAEALELSGGGPLVELGPPAGAYLAMDEGVPRFPARGAALRWDERHGWSLVVEPSSAEEVLFQAYLGIDVLPAPHVVARFATRLLRGKDAGRPDARDLRTIGVEDDLPQRLRFYTPTGDPGRAEHTDPTTTPTLAAGPEMGQPAASDLVTVRADRHGPHLVLHVQGELDMLTTPLLQESVTLALDERPDRLILDLTEVWFFGSSGIAVLLDAYDGVRTSQTQVHIVADGQTVLRPLEVVGLANTVTIYPTLQAALADALVDDQPAQTHPSRPTGRRT